MTDNETVEDSASSERRRIDQYLRDSGLFPHDHRVVPLTGDASTRRYFRVIPTAGPAAVPSIVLALHDGPIEFATLPFVNVGHLLSQMPLPVPAVIASPPPDIVAPGHQAEPPTSARGLARASVLLSRARHSVRR